MPSSPAGGTGSAGAAVHGRLAGWDQRLDQRPDLVTDHRRRREDADEDMHRTLRRILNDRQSATTDTRCRFSPLVDGRPTSTSDEEGTMIATSGRGIGTLVAERPGCSKD